MKHCIGCAISFNIFEDMTKEDAIELCSAFGGKEQLFAYLSQNVDFVELRTVRAYSDPETVAESVNILNSYGITATIHGALGEVDEFFVPYSKLHLAKQDFYNITVHPIANYEETVRILRDICNRIEEEKYPYYITLENQRMEPGTEFGVCEDVVKVVEEINSPHLGLCFDFGHQLSNTYKGYTEIVTDRFLSRVAHTHIHSYYEGTTHYPLDHGEVLFEKNLTSLFEHGYDKVLSLELAPDRYCDKFEVRSSYENSVSILKTAAQSAENKRNSINLYKENYIDILKDLRMKFESSGDCICLVGPSAYILKLNNTFIAIDIAPGILPASDTAKTYLKEWLQDCDAYIVTHAHADHYSPEVLNALSDKTKRFIPDFIDYTCKNVITTHDGSEYSVGEIKISFFNSAHTLGDNSLRELGFYLEYNGRKYLFPVDVRDYKYKYPKFDNVRVLFAHLWLGKGNSLNHSFEPYITDFCDFLKSFNAKECKIAHLDDIHRTLDEMWSDIHFNEVNIRMTNTQMFKFGDILKL